MISKAAQTTMIVVALLSSSALAEATELVPGARDHALFAQSNELFEKGRATGSDRDLEEAARGYEALIERGFSSAALHFNLGNTQLALGKRGEAVLSLRRALLLEPLHSRSRATLDGIRDVIRKENPDLLSSSESSGALETLLFWHYGLSAGERLALLVVSSLAFWSLLLLGLATTIPFRRTLASLLFALSAALAISLLVSSSDRRTQQGVVVKEFDLREENRGAAAVVLDRKIPPGIEVEISETRGSWRLVELPSGDVGWAPRAALAECDFAESPGAR